MTTFTRTWNASYESTPDGSEDIRLGDNRLRETRTDVRERFDVDHIMNGTIHDGKHEKVSFRSQATTPADEAGDGSLFMDNTSQGRLRFQEKTGAVKALVAFDTAYASTETRAAGDLLFVPTRITIGTAEPEAGDLAEGEIYFRYVVGS